MCQATIFRLNCLSGRTNFTNIIEAKMYLNLDEFHVKFIETS